MKEKISKLHHVKDIVAKLPMAEKVLCSYIFHTHELGEAYTLLSKANKLSKQVQYPFAPKVTEEEE